MRTAHPLGLIAGGLAVVVVDFRTEALDLLLDPFGWLLVAVGAAVLHLRGAAVASAVAGVLSVSDAFLEYQYRLIDPRTNDPVDICPLLEDCAERVVFDPVDGWRFAALAAAIVTGTAAVLLLLRGLRRRALGDGDRAAAARLARLSWVVALAWGLPQVVGISRALAADPVAYDPIWNGGAEYAALLGTVAMGWVVVELCFWVRRAWAVPEGHAQPSPWADLMLRDDQPEGY
jgi:hypothetical protein